MPVPKGASDGYVQDVCNFLQTWKGRLQGNWTKLSVLKVEGLLLSSCRGKHPSAQSQALDLNALHGEVNSPANGSHDKRVPSC